MLLILHELQIRLYSLFCIVHSFKMKTCLLIINLLVFTTSIKAFATRKVLSRTRSALQVATRRTDAIEFQEPTDIKTVGDDDVAQISRNFPFSMIVDQSELKEAIVLAASNPKVTGILIGGRHGTGKSVM